MKHDIEGVFCAAATPVTAEGTPDLGRFRAHCRQLLEDGCHGIAMLGTTGEANSFGLWQRQALFDAAAEAVEASQLLPGTSASSVEDAVALTGQAVRGGARGCVLLPPYYYKDCDDEGYFRFYARVIEGVGDDRLRVVLYHIPQMSMVPISHALIGRLLDAFPGIVVGIKDSSGDLAHAEALVRDFPALGVLAGADPLMLPLLRVGGAGCITATSNLRADALRLVWDTWQDPNRAAEVEAVQDRIVAWRKLSSSYMQLPTIKAMLAHRYGDPEWARLMPPLVELQPAARQAVAERMDAEP